MPRALSEDMRWKIVYQRIAEGEPWSRIAGPFVSKTTAKDIVRLFLETRGVTSRQGERAAPPANQVMTEEVCIELLHRVLESPQTTRREHHLELLLDGVVTSVHVSTVCRAMHRMRLSTKRLNHYAAARDADRARAFVVNVVREYEGRMHLHADETAKNGTEFRRLGIATRGESAICSDGFFGGALHTRHRHSFLTSFDMNGFIAWQSTTGTFTKETFLAAAKNVIIPYVTPFPGPRSLVFVDNATIHHSFAFVRAVNRAGGAVIYLVPYCWELSPLDNGACGLVRRWLERNYQYLYDHGLEAAMDAALRSLTPEDARYCFRNCGYVYF